MDVTGPLKCPKETVLQRYHVTGTDSLVNDLGETVHFEPKKCDKCKKDIDLRSGQDYLSCNDCCNSNFHYQCLDPEAQGVIYNRNKDYNGIITKFDEQKEKEFSSKKKEMCLLINSDALAHFATPDIYVLNPSHHKELTG